VPRLQVCIRGFEGDRGARVSGQNLKDSWAHGAALRGVTCSTYNSYLKERAQLHRARRLKHSVDEPTRPRRLVCMRRCATRCSRAEKRPAAGGSRLASLRGRFGRQDRGRDGSRVPLVEMIHTYSLIHDDLPCMDDDDMRRGRARPITRFMGESGSRRSRGDALLTDAFKVLALFCGTRLASPALVLENCRGTCERRRDRAGWSAGAGDRSARRGQVEDGRGARRAARFKKDRSTVPGVGARRLRDSGGAERVADRVARRITRARLGLAFQVVDDLLDVQGTPEQMGKRGTQKDGETRQGDLSGDNSEVERSMDLAREAGKRGAHRALAGLRRSRRSACGISRTFVVGAQNCERALEASADNHADGIRARRCWSSRAGSKLRDYVRAASGGRA